MILLVRHRIDGLEIKPAKEVHPFIVRHRIDGLENVACKTVIISFVRHRIDGLEKTPSSKTIPFFSSPSHRWFRNKCYPTTKT